jgi:hypothetical protein
MRAVGIFQRAGAAHDGRDVFGRRDLRRQLHGHECFGPLGDALLGQRHHLDHALVGFARGGAEREDAVLVEDQALDLWIFIERVGCGFRQRKARHDVGHVAHARAVNLRAQRGGVGLIDQAEHRGGVRMVDDRRRNEGVQQRFDRRRGRLRIEQRRAQYAGHVVVG